jgi:hypothetical protein
MTRKLFTIATLVALLGTTACDQELILNLPNDDETVVTPPGDDDPTKEPGEGEGEGEGEVEQPPPPPPPPSLAESTKGLLVWKRYRAIEQDLMRGLDLDKASVCSELGIYSCIDDVHLAALGGNEPFEKSQYEPSREPTATSSIAIDRVVLSACAERVNRDRAGTPTLFTGLDLDGTSVSDNESDEVTTTLFRKLLARDPSAAELEKMRMLTEDADGLPVSGADYAKLSCYAVGTHVEFLFF